MPESFSRRLGRRLLPLLQPTRDEDQRAQEQLLKRQRDDIEALRRELRETAERMNSLRADVSSGFAKQSKELADATHEVEVVNRDNLRRLQTSVSRSGAFVKGVLRNARHITDHAVEQQRVLDRLARIAASNRPIIAGPWTGEVGFELLYWVPFLRWFVEHYAVDPQRLVVLSRGGPRSWYGPLAARYVDVFDVLAPSALASSTETRKQRSVSRNDRAVLRHAAAQIGGRASVLHPSYLYALCGAYFDGFMGVRALFDHLQPRRIEPPPRTLVPGLPDRYVAAKFYFSASFPDTAENRAFIDGLLARVAHQRPIVLLDQPHAVDDHHAYGGAAYRSLGSLGVTVTPQNNLDVQTAVVAHADAFIGTYGGFSYLAPLCGVEAVAFYAADEFYEHHRYLADVTFSRLHTRPLTVLPAGSAGLVGQLLGVLGPAPASR